MSNWLSGLRRFGLLLVTGCAALIASSGLMYAQGFAVTNLTNNTASKASFPTMVVDANGNLNLAWVDSTAGIKFLRSTSSASGTSFGSPAMAITVSPALPAFQPQMAVNPTQPSQIEITWAVPDSLSTPTAPLYDVFASFSNNSGANFATSSNISGPVALFDSPRVAFDSTGTVNVVWGRTGVWISQATDGVHFGLATSLLLPPPVPAPDTGGPRIAVSGSGHIFVAWTDEASKGAQNSYCTPGTPSTTTVGGNFWMNETLPTQPPTPPSASNTRNLSNSPTDWASPNRQAVDIQRFPVGFFGCSYDNLKLYTDKPGNVHLLWSDDSPIADVLNSKTLGTNTSGFTTFSFPINIANRAAAAPDVDVDKNGSIYVVWSGDATPSSNAEGTFFSRSDDGGGTFTSCAPGQLPLCPATNIAPSGALASAFPHVAVDASGNVNVAWEQPTAAISNGSNVFNVFFARSTDKGVTFPVAAQVSASPSVLCFENDPPPAGNGALPTTPDMSTCGTVQIGVSANSTPDVVWVNQASGAAVADIDFATSTSPTGTLSSNAVSLTASSATANVSITVNGFTAPITFSCLDADKNAALPSWLACSFSPPTLNPAQGNTDTLTITRQGTPTSGMFISAPSAHNLPVFGRSMAWSITLVTLSLMTMLLLAMGRRRDLGRAILMRGFLVMTLTIVLAAGLVSCGGGTSKSTSGTTGGTGGTGGGSTVTMHVAIQAQSGGSTTTLGTVTITAQ
jgi:hypothetical protein